MMRFISYLRPLLQDWEKWLLYVVHKNKNRDSKPQEKILNKMEMSVLPNKEFKLVVTQ